MVEGTCDYKQLKAMLKESDQKREKIVEGGREIGYSCGWGRRKIGYNFN